MQEAEQAGIAASLTKPVRQSQLFDCLMTVISSRSAPQAEELTQSCTSKSC